MFADGRICAFCGQDDVARTSGVLRHFDLHAEQIADVRLHDQRCLHQRVIFYTDPALFTERELAGSAFPFLQAGQGDRRRIVRSLRMILARNVHFQVHHLLFFSGNLVLQHIGHEDILIHQRLCDAAFIIHDIIRVAAEEFRADPAIRKAEGRHLRHIRRDGAYGEVLGDIIERDIFIMRCMDHHLPY